MQADCSRFDCGVINAVCVHVHVGEQMACSSGNAGHCMQSTQKSPIKQCSPPLRHDDS